MPITDITVRFMRRVQVKDYEPMEAEITAVLTVEEGEAVPSAAALLIETKEAVMQGLRHRTDTPLPTGGPITAIQSIDEGINPVVTDPIETSATVREPGKPSPGKKRRTAAEVAEDAKALADLMDNHGTEVPSPASPDLDPADPAIDPDMEAWRQKRAADVLGDDLGPDPEASSAEGPDLSEFDAPLIAAAETLISDAELLKIATTGATVLSADGVRIIIAGFGVKQLVQLDADQRATFRGQITDAIAAAKT